MKEATIAIIIPVFNVENVVNETLLSVKNQTMQPDEVIIINDGSTDNSLKIINYFKNLHGWKIISTSNQGLGLTRNFGRSISNSDYIYFLDSDDIVTNDFIFRIHQIINENNNPDMILFSGESFNVNGNFKKPNLKFSFSGKYLRKDQLITQLIKKRESFPQVSRYLTKKLLWTKNKLDYPKGIGQDDAVFFPLLALSECTVVTSETFYKYRVGRLGSISAKLPISIYAKDYLNLIKFTLKFMNLNYDLIKKELQSWHYRLERRGLKYISMCLKTNTPISWKIIFSLFYRLKSISFILKSLWRFLRYFLKL